MNCKINLFDRETMRGMLCVESLEIEHNVSSRIYITHTYNYGDDRELEKNEIVLDEEHIDHFIRALQAIQLLNN